jgi:hypothetical protein
VGECCSRAHPHQLKDVRAGRGRGQVSTAARAGAAASPRHPVSTACSTCNGSRTACSKQAGCTCRHAHRRKRRRRLTASTAVDQAAGACHSPPPPQHRRCCCPAAPAELLPPAGARPGHRPGLGPLSASARSQMLPAPASGWRLRRLLSLPAPAGKEGCRGSACVRVV